MNKIKIIFSILAIFLGVLMFIYSEIDDSPGGQLLGLLAFVAGIMVVIRSKKKTPTQIFSKFWIAILLSFLINAPFVVGELITQDVSSPRSAFPFSLFIALWVEMALFAYILRSVIQTFRNSIASKKLVRLVVEVLVLGILAWAWITLIIDQWPCFFLGGSGC